MVARTDGARLEPPHAGPRRLIAAIAAPLGVVALAYGLWWISDRLVSIGPVDRATFGWAVVVPVWMLAPFFAALAWRHLDERTMLGVAAVVGAVLALAATILYWLAVALPDCEFGAVRTPAEWVLPSLVFGVVVGGGFGATCFISAGLLRAGRPLAAGLTGAGIALVLVFVAILVAVSFVFPGVGICIPPPRA